MSEKCEKCRGPWREIEPLADGTRRAVCTACDATSAKAAPGRYDDGIHWLSEPTHWRYDKTPPA